MLTSSGIYRDAVWHVGIAVLAVAVACLPPLSNGVLVGTVIAGTPVAGAQIRIWGLDLQGQPLMEGQRRVPPVAETITDEAGRFRVELGPTFGNLFVEAIGGQTREIGSTEVFVLDSTDRLWAVLPLYEPVPERAIVISPLTAIAAELGGQRSSREESLLYHEVMRDTYTRLGQHLGGVDVTDTPVWPIDEPVSQVTPPVRYGLYLAAFSLLAKRIAESGQGSTLGINSIHLTRALVADASGTEGLLDGIGPDGPIALGLCPPPSASPCVDCRRLCNLSTETLRTDLAETLAFHLIGSDYDGTGLEFGDGAAIATALVEGIDPVLFGDVQPGTVSDDEGPRITLLSSPFYDESQDVIHFAGTDGLVHRHSDAALIDLSSIFAGECEQTIHKHVNLLRSPNDNPLRWRFGVYDRAIGFRPEDIAVTLGAASASTPHRLDVVAAEGTWDMPGLGTVFEAVALREQAVTLARAEEEFTIQIAAKDRSGNASEVLTGCWRHVPRAAPLYAGQAEFAFGSGSLERANLVNDDLALLIANKQPPSLGYPLVGIPVANFSGESVYLTAELEELYGTYSRTWVSARALLRQDAKEDTCLTQDPPTCTEVVPRNPRVEDTVSGEPLPAAVTGPDAFLAIRVVDGSGAFLDGCDSCRPGEVRLEPQRNYKIQVVATTLDFLVPAGIDASRVRRIFIGPDGEETQLTGLVDESNYRYCAEQDGNICKRHQFFALYQAFKEVRMDVHSVRITARTAPSPTLTPEVPRPPDSGESFSTLSTPILGSYAYSTAESRLPIEGDHL